MLIVEDGTGIADAESFASVAFADEWLGDRGGADWLALSTSEKEVNLRKATDYMVETYRFLDTPLTEVQGLPMPGVKLGYPSAVAIACVMLADRVRTVVLSPDSDGRVVKRKYEEVVDAVKEETEYDTARRPARYPAVDQRLIGIAVRRGAGAFVALVR